MWREDLRNNEEGQCDTLPMTGGGAGRGPNGFITVTLTALRSPAWGKSMVSAETGGGGGECPMPWEKTGQRPSGDPGNVWRYFEGQCLAHLEHHTWHCLRREGATEKIIMLAKVGIHRQWRGDTRRPSTHGALSKVQSNQRQYVENTDTDACMGIGAQKCGGETGCQKGSERLRPRRKRMAKFWEPLDKPSGKGEGLGLREREGHSRREPERVFT